MVAGAYLVGWFALVLGIGAGRRRPVPAQQAALLEKKTRLAAGLQ
jgi:hypothetical protein